MSDVKKSTKPEKKEDVRCSKGIKISNGFVMSGLMIGITTLSVFGIIIAYFILVFFGVPLNVIYVFMGLILFAFILISVGVMVYKNKCESENETDILEDE